MKKTLFRLAMILVATSLIAGGVDMAPPIIVTEITTLTAYTNGASDATSEIPLYGYLEGIHIEAAAGTTTSVDIVAIGPGPDRTLFSIDSMTSTNAYYPVRLPLVSTAGIASPNTATSVVARIPIVGNKVKVMAYSAGSTNKSITVRLYLDDN